MAPNMLFIATTRSESKVLPCLASFQALLTMGFATCVCRFKGVILMCRTSCFRMEDHPVEVEEVQRAAQAAVHNASGHSQAAEHLQVHVPSSLQNLMMIRLIPKNWLSCSENPSRLCPKD
eukprot:6481863-Amphidinium_carterae.1